MRSSRSSYRRPRVTRRLNGDRDVDDDFEDDEEQDESELCSAMDVAPPVNDRPTSQKYGPNTRTINTNEIQALFSRNDISISSLSRSVTCQRFLTHPASANATMSSIFDIFDGIAVCFGYFAGFGLDPRETSCWPAARTCVRDLKRQPFAVFTYTSS